MERKTVVVTGATGHLGKTWIRALVPAGYNVKPVGRKEANIRVYSKIPDNPYEVLDDLVSLPVHIQDLTEDRRYWQGIFDNASVAILAAANPHPEQTKESAERNYKIDTQSIDAALDAGVKTIIYTSSVWRIMGLVDGENLIKPDMCDPKSEYGIHKAKAVEYLQRKASDYPDVAFIYNDHGWSPRETSGAPPINVTDRGFQLWIAEKETQHHIVRQVELTPDYQGTNFHGFFVISNNQPTVEAKKYGHRDFIFDLTTSRELGIELEANIYKLLEQYTRWRTIPLHMP